MNRGNFTCEPIKDMERVKVIIEAAYSKKDRIGLMVVSQLNLGLRISDIITLRAGDLSGPHLTLTEKKTQKNNKIKINNTLKDSVRRYVEVHDLQPQDYLFFSRLKSKTHISTRQAQKDLKALGEELNLERFSTHSLRKTFGYFAYHQSEGNLPLLMQRFNHSSQAVTLRYIGITQDQLDDLSDEVSFGI